MLRESTARGHTEHVWNAMPLLPCAPIAAGESERRLREVFAAAAKDAASGRPVVIFLDEVRCCPAGAAAGANASAPAGCMSQRAMGGAAVRPLRPPARRCAGGHAVPAARRRAPARGPNRGPAAHAAGRHRGAQRAAARRRRRLGGQAAAAAAAGARTHPGGCRDQPAQRSGPCAAARWQAGAGSACDHPGRCGQGQHPTAGHASAATGFLCRPAAVSLSGLLAAGN